MIYHLKDGMFSGYDEENEKYEKSTWTLKTDEEGKILKIQHYKIHVVSFN